MKTIALLNAKGGVGKTTSTINIAAILAEKKKRVLVVDMDPQGNTTMTYYPIWEGPTVRDVLKKRGDDIHSVIQETEFENIDLLPSTKEQMRDMEATLLVDTSGNPHIRLRKALRKVKDEYDYCIIDCPPNLNMLTTIVLIASDMVLVPLKIDNYAISGLDELIKNVNDVVEEFDVDCEITNCFITMDTRANIQRDVKEQLEEMLGDKFCETSIRNTCKVTESTFEAPVVVYEKGASASIDYRALVKEVFGIE